MGLFDTIGKKIQERRVKRLEKDLTALRNKQRFNPAYLLMAGNNFDSENAFTKRIYEYKVWSMGNAAMLCWFYRTGNVNVSLYDYNKFNYFWAKCPTDRRMVHCGIPGLISSRMADILFKNGVEVNTLIYTNDGESLKENKQLQEKADEFIKDVLFQKLRLQQNIQTAAVNESWGGHCFFRLSHDSSVSAFPILETFDITQCEIIKERKQTKAIIFKSWYEYKNDSYRLDEIYTTTESGDACIQYKLFKFDADKEKEVDLLSIPQTQEMFYITESGNADGIHLDEQHRFVYMGLKGMLAFEKPNRTPSLEYPDSNYGASDYEGCIDEFDVLDEITSANALEIRTNETKRYIPESMMPRDKNGNILPFEEFCNSFVAVKCDPDQNGETKITESRIDDKTTSYLEKWKKTLSTVCNNAKISPSSLGITWLEAVGPSAESQRERNKTTLDMREGKLALWATLLKELILQALKLNVWMRNNTEGIKQKQEAEGAFDLDITSANTTIQLSFGEYISEGISQRLTTWGGAKAQRVASTEECIRQIHPDWTKKQVNDEANLIRFEDGMSVDNPSNLPELTGEDEDEENGVI